MVRTCQADEQLEKQFEDLLKRQAGPEVGLLVGRHAPGGKVLLYGTIKTPRQEGLAPILVTGGAAPAGPAATGKGGKKGGGAGGVAVTLETEWITEHVRQVVRMLPGGLAVLGLYVFCADAAHSAGLPQLCALLASLAPACLPRPRPHRHAAAPRISSPSISTASSPAGDCQPDHLLLLHVDASSRKQALRALPAPPSSTSLVSASALRPCELRFAPTLGSLVLLRCWHGVDLALPVPAIAGPGGAGTGAEPALRLQLSGLVDAEVERIRRGIFIKPGGGLLSESTPVAEALAAAGGSNKGTAAAATAATAATAAATRDYNDYSLPLSIPVCDLTLLAPLPPSELSAARPDTAHQQQQHGESASAGWAEGGGMRVAGQGRLRGAVQGLAVVNKREAVGRAAEELKADLIASLTSRMELLAEEAAPEADAEVAAGPGEGPAHPLLRAAADLAAGGCDVALPRRAVLPWLGGSLALCDYLLEGETVELAAERARQLLGLELEGPHGEHGQVGEAEQPATSATSSAPWQPNAISAQVLPGPGRPTPSPSASAPGLLGSCSLTVLASCAVAAVAGAVGLLSLAANPAGGE